jgi:hypothetical protein
VAQRNQSGPGVGSASFGCAFHGFIEASRFFRPFIKKPDRPGPLTPCCWDAWKKDRTAIVSRPNGLASRIPKCRHQGCRSAIVAARSAGHDSRHSGKRTAIVSKRVMVLRLTACASTHFCCSVKVVCCARSRFNCFSSEGKLLKIIASRHLILFNLFMEWQAFSSIASRR